MGLEQLQSARREQVIGGRRVRAVDRDHIGARQHLVEAFPVGRLELLGDARADRFAVVIVDGQAERARALRQRLADPPHAHDAEALARQPAAHHPGRRPAVELPGLDDVGPLDDPTRGGEDEAHGQVGGVLGQNARACWSRRSRARWPRRRRYGRRRRRNWRSVSAADRLWRSASPSIRSVIVQARTSARATAAARALDIHGDVVEIELGVEQLTHAGFNRIRELSRHDNFRLAKGHGSI